MLFVLFYHKEGAKAGGRSEGGQEDREGDGGGGVVVEEAPSLPVSKYRKRQPRENL